jgi:hypothetical protein
MEFIETFLYIIKYKQDKKNIVVNVLSRMYVLFNTLNTRLLEFRYVKELYFDDTNFGEIYFQYELVATNGFFRHDVFLCMSNCSMHELLIRAAYDGGLMRHFGIIKTLEFLHEYFYWPNMKRDV